MSSPAYALPLRLERRPSRGLAWGVTVVHVLAMVVILPLALPWWVKLVVSLAVIAQGILIWRNHVSPIAAGAIREIVWKADGEWELVRVDGGATPTRLRRASYVQPALVVLRFIEAGGRRRSVLLPADGVDAELHRRLRVALRLHAETV